jgi:hypothetical protein
MRERKTWLVAVAGLLLGCGGENGSTGPTGPTWEVTVKISGAGAELFSYPEPCPDPVTTFGSECTLFRSCQEDTKPACKVKDIAVYVNGSGPEQPVKLATSTLVFTNISSLTPPYTVRSDAPAFELSGVTPPQSPPVLTSPFDGASIPTAQSLAVLWESAVDSTDLYVTLDGTDGGTCDAHLECHFRDGAGTGTIPKDALSKLLSEYGPEVLFSAVSVWRRDLSLPDANVHAQATGPWLPGWHVTLTNP